jgi:hypothetical protein
LSGEERLPEEVQRTTSISVELVIGGKYIPYVFPVEDLDFFQLPKIR